VLKTYREKIVDWQGGNAVPDGVIWIDLLNPTDEEKRMVEGMVKVRILPKNPSARSRLRVASSWITIFCISVPPQ
jgi:Mg2+ and Co2+ transporter CorA